MTTRSTAALLLPAAAAFAPEALAQDETRIATVQAPAWVERDGRGIGARPGFVLQAGDVLRTGPRGRVHVDTPDGSIVKLGSDGTIGFNQLALRAREQDTVFEGVMNVLKGAFRFTTRLAGKANRRDVRVRVGVVTAGVRGTGIWGKSDLEKDLVCLLEGTISVTSDGAPEQTMSEGLTFYVVPHGAQPNPIAPGRNRAAARVSADFGVVVEAGGRPIDLVQVLDHRLATLEGHDFGDLALPAADSTPGRPDHRQ